MFAFGWSSCGRKPECPEEIWYMVSFSETLPTHLMRNQPKPECGMVEHTDNLYAGQNITYCFTTKALNRRITWFGLSARGEWFHFSQLSQRARIQNNSDKTCLHLWDFSTSDLRKIRISVAQNCYIDLDYNLKGNTMYIHQLFHFFTVRLARNISFSIYLGTVLGRLC